MVAASLFGLINEGLQYAAGGVPTLMIGGLLTGVVLVEASDRLLNRIDIGTEDHTETNRRDGHGNDRADAEYTGTTTEINTDGGSISATNTEAQRPDDHRLEAKAFADGDVKTLVLILGILTVHSFPEGVAVGVSFAELGFEGA